MRYKFVFGGEGRLCALQLQLIEVAKADACAELWDRAMEARFRVTKLCTSHEKSLSHISRL